MLELNGYEVILASGSPRRKMFFEQLGIPFKIETFSVDESFPTGLEEVEIAKYIVTQKSLPFRKSVTSKKLIVTADTIVWCENQYLGKPKDLEQAKEMLAFLSGKSHKVITSVGFLTHKVFEILSETTIVHFKKLSSDEISHYINSQPPLDKAGAYGIQDWIGEIGITKIEGSYTNVVGLPLAQVKEHIKLLTQK
ncbi:MAG: septum formation protein Maf [Flavobacteriales bacterium MED-G15]|nr:MAG: septum formation protein Maf [Flavobacteriales bacterium MED-G15]|tara:strand:+ start:129 stop:713 length:585 start_codon:yes stop_codon:yes gene_type:complete